MLGPALFNVCINDIYASFSSSDLVFADDAKLYTYVCTCDQLDRLQCDLHNKLEWSTKWQMLFNPDKCEFLHVWQLP